MEKDNKTVGFQEYKYKDLPNYAANLLKEAKKMLKVAYAPYSNFLVGAAVLLESGEVHVGCNHENASYPLCICGERVALFNSHANSPGKKIIALAIIAKNPAKKLKEPVSPCGACRQVISEFEMKQKAPIEIFLQGESTKVLRLESGNILLPFSFSSDVL